MNQIFNRSLKQIQRDNSILNPQSYLRDEMASRLCDRLFDIKRTFPNMLDLGSGSGHVLKHIDPSIVQSLTCFEMSREMLNSSQSHSHSLSHVEFKQGDESNLPWKENTFDAVVSNCSLHWINDLLGTLIQVKNVLKPDGLFLGCLLGGETLYELRTCLQLAEMERKGGISPHISPMVRDRDMGSLLSRAGFTLTTGIYLSFIKKHILIQLQVDVDEICVEFPTMFELIQDLQSMGENNALQLDTFPSLSKDVLLSASAIYKEIYGNEHSIPATFQVIYMIGWKPDVSQPKPLPKGSGKISLKTLEQE